MRTFLLSGLGLSGATVFGLFAWVLKVCHETPSSAEYPAHLLWGVDEYWNGEYPEDEQESTAHERFASRVPAQHEAGKAVG